jgi:hypothetical protein
VKTRFNFSLAILGSVCLLASAVAQKTATPVPIPPGTPIGHLYAIVGSDGIAHLVSKAEFDAHKGVSGQGGCPAVPIFDALLDNGFYRPPLGAVGGEQMDSLPVAGSSTFDEHTWTYFMPVVNGRTADANVNIYDMTVATAFAQWDQYELACTAAGALLLSYSITGLPEGAFYVTVTGLGPLNAVGDLQVGVGITPTDLAADTGLIHASGNNNGMALGRPSGSPDLYPGSTGGHQSSANDSANYWMDDAGCWWYAQGLQANFAHQVVGNHGVTVSLGGDYGTLGGTWDAPDNYVTVRVFDGVAAYDTVCRMTSVADAAGSGHFSIPFDFSAEGSMRDIYVRGFGSMMNAGATGVVIGAASAGSTTCVSLAMTAGDVDHNNTIDVFDLNAVLVNFGKSGAVLP